MLDTFTVFHGHRHQFPPNRFSPHPNKSPYSLTDHYHFVLPWFLATAELPSALIAFLFLVVPYKRGHFMFVPLCRGSSCPYHLIQFTHGVEHGAACVCTPFLICKRSGMTPSGIHEAEWSDTPLNALATCSLRVHQPVGIRAVSIFGLY